MIVHGWIEGKAEKPAPSGATGAAWKAWIKSRSPHGVVIVGCADGDLDHVVVGDGSQRLRIDRQFFRLDAPRDLVSELLSLNIRIDVAQRTPVPVDTRSRFIAARCPTIYQPQEYNEIVLPEGAAVEVSGCKIADRLVPCNDGADVITTDHVDGLGVLAKRRHEWRSTWIAAAAATALAMFAVLIPHLRRLSWRLVCRRAPAGGSGQRQARWCREGWRRHGLDR
jgi:hypothetical protein